MEFRGIEICERNRFSLFVKSDDEEGLAVLTRWVGWFEERGVKSVLYQDEQKGYAVYRNGMKDDEKGENDT